MGRSAMKKIHGSIAFLIVIFSGLACAESNYTFKAGHDSLKNWLLPKYPQSPAKNSLTPERTELGKKLFFDPRLSGDKNMSCATCHNPLFGWSDGLPTAKGSKSKVLKRASPTIVNSGYNSIQMWDGRKKSLEDQALGPMLSSDEMNVDIPSLVAFLRGNPGYSEEFAKAYPGEKIEGETIAKAISAFERTIVSRESRFDKWIAGDKKALNKSEVRGFKVFINPEKGNCEVCHSAPNFTDNGFHNIGLASFADTKPDLGRYTEKPIGVLKGAFKTPTVRNIALTAPYFHDGSADTLEEVVDHYISGGTAKSNLSPNLKKISLSKRDKKDLVNFMLALTSPEEPFSLPVLPK